MRTFLAMGGYGAFVWPAFGASAVVLGWLWVSSLRRLRGLERALAAHGLAAPGGGRKPREGAVDGKGETAP
ncbi:MAG: heme exporter protein CcmD [Proteobacteria bacterium]|nr:heme exporter protein CcmD [Pseudomonadota bacterium]